MPSTRDLSGLPDAAGLRRLTQSLALLDAILCPEWEYRRHSFDARWAPGEAMASARDGAGDGYFLWFGEPGAILKGFARESPAWSGPADPDRPPPGVFDRVPDAFARFLAEPAFTIADSTFCIWRRPGDPAWQAGGGAPPGDEDHDGSAELLALLDGDPDRYRAWAEDYFETEVPRRAVDHIYAHQPLTGPVVHALNPELDIADLAGDLAEIGYPAPRR